ncbi:hydrolase [Pectobacterium bacteriophage PM2]|uniref:Uncharacterized protein n=1 Tax=Pectobacterium bacteriophage PM2 TaxID=1429794 RepID=A0A0A0Q3E3_9CAUD|nr:hydrolase [Pectobacterium bacteriophage PM2]AHY25052.1 hypothetical protein PM2_090 [Pectobacterium bacteriophage PM2]
MKLPDPLEFAKRIASVQPIDGNILKDLIRVIGGSIIISAKPIPSEGSNKSVEALNV